MALQLYYSPYTRETSRFIDDDTLSMYKRNYIKDRSDAPNVYDMWDEFIGDYYHSIGNMKDMIDMLDVMGDEDISIKAK